jgi:hypothetical protein
MNIIDYDRNRKTNPHGKPAQLPYKQREEDGTPHNLRRTPFPMHHVTVNKTSGLLQNFAKWRLQPQIAGLNLC